MKRLPTLLLATLAASFVACPLPAAEPGSSFGLAPSAAPQLPAAPATDAPAATTPAATTPAPDVPAVPEAAEPPRKLTKEEQYAGMDKTAVAEDKRRKLMQYRVATVKAERDPGLQAIKARALVARTDFEQRKIFIEYYTKLYELIGKMDPTIKKDELAQKRDLYIARFVQGRVAATIDPAIARAKRN